MASINKVFLIGNVGKEPTIREGQFTVATFPLATTERIKTRDGEVKENTCWHNIVTYRGAAELVKNNVTKGTQLFLEGKISTRSYTDEGTGERKFVTEIIASNIQLLGGKRKERQESAEEENYYDNYGAYGN